MTVVHSTSNAKTKPMAWPTMISVQPRLVE